MKGEIGMYDEIITEFVRDRIKETSWKDREYISSLQRIERTLWWGGPKQFGEAMSYGNAKSAHPVEWECIKKEIQDGIRTTSEEFRRKADEYEKKKRVEERKCKLERIKKEISKEDKELAKWLELGGRP